MMFVVTNSSTMNAAATAMYIVWSANDSSERVISKNMGVLHMEGGWPKDIDPTEKDQTQRYRKKVEKDETYIKEVKAMGDAVEKEFDKKWIELGFVFKDETREMPKPPGADGDEMRTK